MSFERNKYVNKSLEKKTRPLLNVLFFFSILLAVNLSPKLISYHINDADIFLFFPG